MWNWTIVGIAVLTVIVIILWDVMWGRKGRQTNLDFFFGYLICLLVGLSLENYHGLEGYIANVRESWINVPFSVTGTVTALVIVYYIITTSKRRK